MAGCQAPVPFRPRAMGLFETNDRRIASSYLVAPVAGESDSCEKGRGCNWCSETRITTPCRESQQGDAERGLSGPTARFAASAVKQLPSTKNAATTVRRTNVLHERSTLTWLANRMAENQGGTVEIRISSSMVRNRQDMASQSVLELRESRAPRLHAQPTHFDAEINGGRVPRPWSWASSLSRKSPSGNGTSSGCTT